MVNCCGQAIVIDARPASIYLPRQCEMDVHGKTTRAYPVPQGSQILRYRQRSADLQMAFW